MTTEKKSESLWGLIKELIWAARYKRAIKKADRLAKAFHMRYYVLNIGKKRAKLAVVPKQNIKKLIRERRFKKGVTIKDIDKIALYVTAY